jgi:hypothetical protein
MSDMKCVRTFSIIEANVGVANNELFAIRMHLVTAVC